MPPKPVTFNRRQRAVFARVASQAFAWNVYVRHTERGCALVVAWSDGVADHREEVCRWAGHAFDEQATARAQAAQRAIAAMRQKGAA